MKVKYIPSYIRRYNMLTMLQLMIKQSKEPIRDDNAVSTKVRILDGRKFKGNHGDDVLMI